MKLKHHGTLFGEHKKKGASQVISLPSTPRINTIINDQQLFTDSAKTITVSLSTIREQLKTLEANYNNYFTLEDDSNKIQIKIDNILKDIYSNGSTILDSLKKISPKILFTNSELSKEKLADYQSQHDEFASELKYLWVELYDLKQVHKLKQQSFVKYYMQANYPNASEKEVEHIATEIVEKNYLWDAKVFYKYTQSVEVLNYVTARYKQVLKLEESINELHQLFVDTLVLTQQQGETIERIRERIQTTKDLIKSSVDDLKEAKRAKQHWF